MENDFDYGVTGTTVTPENKFANEPTTSPNSNNNSDNKGDKDNFNTIIDAADLNTLDESVWKSVWRDLKLLLLRTWHVIWVFGKSRNALVYQEWDLWGPVIYTLLLASFSSINANMNNQSQADAESIFFRILLIVIVGSIAVGVNIILLKGTISIFGTISMLGYCSFPLVIATCISLITTAATQLRSVRLIVVGVFGVVCCVWSIMATYGFFKGMLPVGKKFLAVFPVCFFYCILAFNNIQAVDYRPK